MLHDKGWSCWGCAARRLGLQIVPFACSPLSAPCTAHLCASLEASRRVRAAGYGLAPPKLRQLCVVVMPPRPALGL